MDTSSSKVEKSEEQKDESSESLLSSKSWFDAAQAKALQDLAETRASDPFFDGNPATSKSRDKMEEDVHKDYSNFSELSSQDMMDFDLDFDLPVESQGFAGAFATFVKDYLSDIDTGYLSSGSNHSSPVLSAQLESVVSNNTSSLRQSPSLGSVSSAVKNRLIETKNALMDGLKQTGNQAEQRVKLKSLQFLFALKKRIRKGVIGDETRSLRRHWQQSNQVKLLDKLCFTGSLCHILITEYLFVHGDDSERIPISFETYYSVMLMLLMCFRYYTYKSKKWHYFMIDFCYFVNFLAVLHIYVYPNDTWLFEVLFVLAMGPVMNAIFVWRNSMVFHSTDKMTSLFIHVFPPMYVLKYKFLTDRGQNSGLSEHLSMEAWYLRSTLLYFVWQSLYLIKTEWMDADILENDKDISTSMRWMASTHSKSGIAPLTLKYCRKIGLFARDERFDSTQFKTKFVFVFTNFLYFLIMVFPTKWLFSNGWFALGMFFLAIIMSMFNGANYYIEVFSNRYNQMLIDRQSRVESKYANIDENLDRIFRKLWEEVYTQNNNKNNDIGDATPLSSESTTEQQSTDSQSASVSVSNAVPPSLSPL